MERDIYIDWTTGETLYSKDSPLDESVWANGITNLVENGSTGQYSAKVALTHQTIFLQLSGSPADTDTKIGYEPQIIVPTKILGF